MWVGLGAFLLSMVGTLTARVLTSIGVGVVSYAAFNTLATSFTDSVISSFGGTPASVIQILYLCGVGTALNIICSAILTKGTLMAASKLGRVLTS